MKVLILDDDLLVAELLETILSGLYASAVMTIVGTLEDARDAWHAGQFNLLICDWNLPDGSSLEFIRLIRAADEQVAVLMVTSRSDRESVLTAAHYRINGFVSKPFSVVEIRERLHALLPSKNLPGESAGLLQPLLESAVKGSLQLPTSLQPGEIVPLLAQQDQLSAQQLAVRWREQTGLVTRFLDVANGSSFQRSGEPVRTLFGAIKVLGISMSLNLALGLAFDLSHALTDPRLKERADAVLTQSRTVAQTAQAMARSLGVKTDVPYTAGLLSQVGELAVLTVLQRFLNEGGELSEEELGRAWADWSQLYGNQLKVRWRMPIDLRELIGPVHHLHRDETHKERIMMHAAALIAAGQAETDRCQKLLRRIGLDPTLFEVSHAI